MVAAVPSHAVLDVGFLWGRPSADAKLWGFCGDTPDVATTLKDLLAGRTLAAAGCPDEGNKTLGGLLTPL